MSQPQPPFWQRHASKPEVDIALLRPSSLTRGERFETLQDARAESRRSCNVLQSAGSRLLAEHLDDCLSGVYTCGKSYCPVCARKFRRWYIGWMLKGAASAPSHVATILLEEVPRGQLLPDTLAKHRSLIRKRLRQTISNAHVIGCFEVVYKARKKAWVLHINLLLIGAKQTEVDPFLTSWGGGRTALIARLKDPAQQISYVPKFTTYHRPLEQDSRRRSVAKPLNPNEHKELVEWMSHHEFQDLMFLHGCRRAGSKILKTGH